MPRPDSSQDPPLPASPRQKRFVRAEIPQSDQATGEPAFLRLNPPFTLPGMQAGSATMG